MQRFNTEVMLQDRFADASFLNDFHNGSGLMPMDQPAFRSLPSARETYKLPKMGLVFASEEAAVRRTTQSSSSTSYGYYILAGALVYIFLFRTQ